MIYSKNNNFIKVLYMNKLFLNFTLICFGTWSSTTYSIVRPTLLALQALNNSHIKHQVHQTENGDCIVTTASPFATIQEFSTESHDDDTRTISFAINVQPITAENSKLENFNKAQLAFCALTATGISALAKSMSGFYAKKSSLRKSIRKNSTFALSAYIFNEYDKVKELLNWEENYRTSTTQFDEFIRNENQK